MTAYEPRAGDRVVVAMSGGVDSSVAAGLLVESGCEVIGISMRLADESRSRGSGGCCSMEDFRDAARVARRLNIPHYVFDMRKEFDRSVIRPFVDGYLVGQTPSPCILCNREIKFRLLHRKAMELGARFVATGHYARRIHDGGRYRLLRGRDEHKDQSYFLFELGQRELASTLFPVGNLDKDHVRAEAARLGLDVAAKPDSQEICFVADGRYAEFVERAAGQETRPGRIVNEEGREIGRHQGVHRFTVGQRRGLGVAAEEPLYVSELRAKTAEVVAVPRRRLGRIGLKLRDLVWTDGRALPEGSRFSVRIRHRHRPVAARMQSIDEGGCADIIFDEPQDGVSPGQAAVLYDADEVLGGGWITASIEETAGELACA